MNAFKLACLAGVVLCAPSPLFAKNDVVVAATPSVAQWTKAVTRSLESHIRYPAYYWLNPRREGAVRVSFSCSEDGKPAHLVLVKSSGMQAFDRAALSAVSRIKTLHPLPATFRHDQRYGAIVIFAESEASRDRLLARINKDRRVAATSTGSSNGLLALVGPLPEGAQ